MGGAVAGKAVDRYRESSNEPTLIDSAQKEVIRIVSRNHTGATQNVTGTPSTEYSVRGDLSYDGAVTEMSTSEMVRARGAGCCSGAP